MPEPLWKKNSELQRLEAELKKIVDKNLDESLKLKEATPRADLVENFHWVITRFRRLKKLTQEDFAREISEPLHAVKLAEKGVLPDINDYRFIRKIENYLGIILIKDDAAKPERHIEPEKKEVEIETQPSSPIKISSFGSGSLRNLTIGDLKKIKEKTDNADEEEVF